LTISVLQGSELRPFSRFIPALYSVTFDLVAPNSDIPQNSRKREEHFSKDGKWRSFPQVPHLLQYASSANYYGRIKVGGKLIRESLGTGVWTTARLRLVDFIKKHNESRSLVDAPKFNEALELFKTELAGDSTR
jgi:hypothetical protein